MLRKIAAIAWNDIRVEFSERSTIVFFLILPLIFTAILGTANGGSRDDTADNRYLLLVADEDQSDLSAAVLSALEKSPSVRPVLVADAAEGTAALEAEEANAFLHIPTGFGAQLLAGEPTELPFQTAPNSNEVIVIQRATQTAVQQVGRAVQLAVASAKTAAEIQPFADPSAQQAYVTSGLEMAQEMLAEPRVTTAVTQNNAAQQFADGFEQASAGQLVTWVLITLIGTAQVFVAERTGGTLRRLFTMPLGKATVLLGKISGRLGQGLLQMALLILGGAWLFGVNWGQSPAALLIMVLAFALAAVALGVMLATFIQTPQQANGLTIMFSMVLAALGGAWWPLEITPAGYQAAVQILPTTWAMRGFTDVIVRGQGVAEIGLEAAVLCTFAVVFFVVGVARFRYE